MMKKSKPWYETINTYVWIFNTGRGLSVCIRLPQNYGLIYDLGCSKEFSPRDFIEKHIIPNLNKYEDGAKKERDIAQVILSHPHSDHISEIKVKSNHDEDPSYVDTALWTCPHDKNYEDGKEKEFEDEKVDFSRINNRSNSDDLIKDYREAYKERKLPLQTISSKESKVPNVEYGIYYLRPPACDELHPKEDQEYSNATSIVLYLRHGNQNILIPGDITPEAFEKVLETTGEVERRYTYFDDRKGESDSHKKTGYLPSLGTLLKDNGLSVFVTPHHGLESGYCEKIYDYIREKKPGINAISEKRHNSKSDGKVDPRYQSEDGAIGMTVDVEGKKETRYSVSTRENHHILFVFKGTDQSPHVFLRNNPEDLLDIAL